MAETFSVKDLLINCPVTVGRFGKAGWREGDPLTQTDLLGQAANRNTISFLVQNFRCLAMNDMNDGYHCFCSTKIDSIHNFSCWKMSQTKHE